LDIRILAARSVAYILLITVLAGLYSVAVFSISELFLTDMNVARSQQVLNIAVAVVLAFTFQPLKRFFDKVTDKIFYRDSYETEDVLNRLGKVFIAKNNSFELLGDSLDIITNTLKTRNGFLAVIDGKEIYKTETIGDISDTNISINTLRKFDTKLSIYDEVEEDSELYTAFHELDVYAVLRLTVQEELIGFLALGPKQTGTIFTQQDVNLLEILSQELAVAIQNVKSYQKIANFSQTLQREVEEATAQLR
jgi:hypothetical protein